jgi:hypothetical protein
VLLLAFNKKQMTGKQRQMEKEALEREQQRLMRGASQP